MSTTTSTPTPAATSAAITAARDLPTLINNLQSANPQLAAQLVPQALAASRTPWGTIVGTGVGWAVAHYGLACSVASAAVANCWSQDTINIMTGVGVIVGTLVGSYIMRYISVSPIKGLFTTPTKTPTS